MPVFHSGGSAPGMKDPMAAREAARYENPIASREAIANLLQESPGPLTAEEVGEALDLLADQLGGSASGVLQQQLQQHHKNTQRLQQLSQQIEQKTLQLKPLIQQLEALRQHYKNVQEHISDKSRLLAQQQLIMQLQWKGRM